METDDNIEEVLANALAMEAATPDDVATETAVENVDGDGGNETETAGDGDTLDNGNETETAGDGDTMDGGDEETETTGDGDALETNPMAETQGHFESIHAAIADMAAMITDLVGRVDAISNAMPDMVTGGQIITEVSSSAPSAPSPEEYTAEELMNLENLNLL